MNSERGFSLIEVVVAVGITALLLAAGGIWMFSMRPGAIAQAAADFDAALLEAREIAATSGNGATLVFAPRRAGGNGTQGFELRVYRGRPTAAGAVQPTAAMPVTGAAGVRESRLGAPPFAIFLGASGDVSGEGGYPSFDANGSASFAPIASEPPCPSDGFTIVFFTNAASQSRALACAASAVAKARSPNPSPTPNVPLVTPATLVFHWPADAEQSFVATEWGYTHWFATADGFACGAGVATFPDVLPSPYSPPASRGEATLAPSPPPNTPFSYPNSGGGSTNDAPARFPLDPASAGLCTAGVADDYGQAAQSSVQVMGWLTAAYGAQAYTHRSAKPIPVAPGTLASKGDAVTFALSKTYDAEPLLPAVALDPACAPFLDVAGASEKTPKQPSDTPATANLTLTLTAKPPANLTCAGTIYDQYPNALEGEGIAFNAVLTSEGPLEAWPPAEQLALSGSALPNAASGSPCYARAFDAKFKNALPAGKLYDASGALLVRTDDTGCIFDASGAAMSGAVAARQVGFTDDFQLLPESCQDKTTIARHWLSPSENGVGPGYDALAISGIQVGTCSMQMDGDLANAASAKEVSISVLGCTSTGGAVPIGGSCSFSLPPAQGTEPCVSGEEHGPFPTLTEYFASFSDKLEKEDPVPTTESPGVGSIENGPSSFTFYRTGQGEVTLYIFSLTTHAHAAGDGCTQGPWETTIINTHTVD